MLALALYLLSVVGLLCLSSIWLVKLVDSVWWKPRQYAETFKRQGIRGYPYKILVGNVREAMRMQNELWSKPMTTGRSHDIVHRVLPFFEDAVREHGNISLSWFGPTPQLIITDPELVKEILSNKFGHFRRPNNPPLLRMLQMGILGLEGEQWAERRRLLNPAFHMEKLKEMLPSFSSSCNELVQRWERSMGEQGSCELDVHVEFQNLTGDIISRTAFGSNYEEGKRIFEIQKEQTYLFAKALPTLFIPGMRFLPTKLNLKRNKLNRKVVSLLNNIIEKRERAMEQGTAKNGDLLGILLESNKNHHEYGSKPLTRDEVIEECRLFYFAGQETTAVLLTWIMIVLAMHSSWQKEARDEVIHVCGNSNPTWDNLTHLKIVGMVIYEVLRLYPPAAFVARQTYKPVKVRDITIPAGVRLALSTIQIHHDSKIWGEDANEFKPERFSTGLSGASKHQLAFFPFSWGPRICLGQSFALMEARMALALILPHFSFELSPSYAHAPHTVITLQPQYGAQIILHRI